MKHVKIFIFLLFLGLMIFGGGLTIPRVIWPGGALQKQLAELRLENQNLRAQLLQGKFTPRREGRHLVAKIYTLYPFNNQNSVMVAAGAADGIKEGMTVTVGGNTLFGEVQTVFDDYSIVRTVFDPDWQIAVRVGDGENDALLAGGLSPILTLIDKNRAIKEGDAVYSSGKNFPYGLIVGQIKEVRHSATDPFQKATLALPYALNELREVWIIAD